MPHCTSLHRSASASVAIEHYSIDRNIPMFYKNAAAEVKYLTGVEISKSAQQRLIHRQNSIGENSAIDRNLQHPISLAKPLPWRIANYLVGSVSATRSLLAAEIDRSL
jgi:hypothetical protein